MLPISARRLKEKEKHPIGVIDLVAASVPPKKVNHAIAAPTKYSRILRNIRAFVLGRGIFWEF